MLYYSTTSLGTLPIVLGLRINSVDFIALREVHADPSHSDEKHVSTAMLTSEQRGAHQPLIYDSHVEFCPLIISIGPGSKPSKVWSVLSFLLDHILMSAPEASIGEKVEDVKGEHPDHVIVIKFVPAAEDSRCTIDEYYSEIMGSGRSTVNIFNKCEDSPLATTLVLNLSYQPCQ